MHPIWRYPVFRAAHPLSFLPTPCHHPAFLPIALEPDEKRRTGKLPLQPVIDAGLCVVRALVQMRGGMYEDENVPIHCNVSPSVTHNTPIY